MPTNLPLRILLEATISCMLMQQFGFLAAGIPSNATRHTVNLSNGSSIQGFVTSVRNKTVWSYLGIPYAKPPVGPLRFKPSEPLETPLGNSSKPFDASSKPNSCYYWPLSPQEFEKKNKALMTWWNNTEMSEDCLYLNVWSPTSDKADKKDNPGKPVMVWIYGGGFFGGSSTLEVYDGAVLAATGDVVVASMQYRTGVLGFLFLDDQEAPGNAGLYDQYRAIQWIHQNIHSFGGDRSRITLFGESAGAVSVSYHMLSPYTQGYFQRAILSSGSAIAWWASENRWSASRKTMKLAELVKCRSGNDDDVTKIMTCMRQVRPELLQEKTSMSMTSESQERDQQYAQYIKEKAPRNQDAARMIKNIETRLFFVVPFKPVFCTDFLPNMPETQLEQSPMKNDVKKADLLVGVVKNEGEFWIMYALSNIFLHKNVEWNIPFWWGQPLSPELNEKYELLVKNRTKFDMDRDPYNLVARYFLTNDTNIDSLISEAVSFEYQVPSKLFGRTSWTAKDTLDALDDMTGDKSFKCPTILFAEMYSQMLGADGANSIWMYSFEHRSELLPLPEWTGVLHGYELDYVFGTPFNQRFTRDYYNFTETEAQLSDDVMKFWTNFAKTGNPNQESKSSSSLNSTQVWPAYERSSRRYIVLSARPSSGLAFRTGQNLRKRQCKFLRYQVPNIRKQIDARFNCSSKSVPPNEEPNGPTSGSGYLRSAIISVEMLALLLYGAVRACS